MNSITLVEDNISLMQNKKPLNYSRNKFCFKKVIKLASKGVFYLLNIVLKNVIAY